jgi:uncharacterized iron-regulated membrane protein
MSEQLRQADRCWPVSRSDGRRSASPDCRIQWHRYVASPPAVSRTSASRAQGPTADAGVLDARTGEEAGRLPPVRSGRAKAAT